MSKPEKDFKDPEPSLSNIVVSGLAIVGALLIMVIVVAFAYLPQRVDTVVGDEMSDEERWELLRSQLDAEERELTSFDWIDRDARVVRLPIDRAMEITVARINDEEKILTHSALEEDGVEIEDEMADPEEEAEEETEPSDAAESPEAPADGSEVEATDEDALEDEDE
ncbi:MAG: hypothetical protein JJT75_03180 [Opitutales bacterium]|nr:hypothetical protein [Opitutales bacterium]MCH8540311.1 hypothetical protein [Opitutales bacterium]